MLYVLKYTVMHFIKDTVFQKEGLQVRFETNELKEWIYLADKYLV